MKNKKIIFLTAVFLMILFVTSFFIITEPFKTEEDTMREQIKAIMTQIDDVVCPATKVILDDYKVPADGAQLPQDESEEAKLTRARIKFEKDLGGPSFPCPPPDDPIQIPADINKRIIRVLKFLDKKLPEMKEKIVAAMNNCNPTQTEGFQNGAPPPIGRTYLYPISEPRFSTPGPAPENMDICPPPEGKTSTPPPPPDKRNTCINPYDMPDEYKPRIIKARLEALSQVLENPETPTLMAKVKSLTVELLEVRKRAENLELAPSCN
jgi:hypothetical protein